MRAYLFLLLFLPALSVAAQGKITSYTLHSKVLQEERFIDLYIPAGNNSCEVIYVLDGAAHFTTIVDLLKQLARQTGDSSFTQKIVVGVGNIWQRDRDYTPTHITSSPFVDNNAAKVSGGGKKFIAFLEKELIPYINSTYRTSSRVLIGHSLGGLMVIHALLNNTSLFSKYAAIDPSMWWDDQKLLGQAKRLLANKTFNQNSLFLAIANSMNKDIDNVTQLRKDSSRKTALNRPSLVLADYINAHKQHELLFDWKYYKDFNHMSVFRSAAYDALKFLLKISGK